MSMQDVKVIEELERRKEFDDALEQVVNEMRDDEWLTLDEIAARCGKKCERIEEGVARKDMNALCAPYASRRRRNKQKKQPRLTRGFLYELKRPHHSGLYGG